MKSANGLNARPRFPEHSEDVILASTCVDMLEIWQLGYNLSRHEGYTKVLRIMSKHR